MLITFPNSLDLISVWIPTFNRDEETSFRESSHPVINLPIYPLKSNLLNAQSPDLCSKSNLLNAQSFEQEAKIGTTLTPTHMVCVSVVAK